MEQGDGELEQTEEPCWEGIFPPSGVLYFFGRILVLIWKSFLEILKTSVPLIRVGNVCITESVKLLHYNKNRRHFDPEN